MSDDSTSRCYKDDDALIKRACGFDREARNGRSHPAGIVRAFATCPNLEAASEAYGPLPRPELVHTVIGVVAKTEVAFVYYKRITITHSTSAFGQLTISLTGPARIMHGWKVCDSDTCQ